MNNIEERIATFLWTQIRSGQWDPNDWEDDLNNVLKDVKSEQDFDSAPGDQSCGEAGNWEDCCEIARHLVSGKRLEDPRRSFCYITIPNIVGPSFVITPTAYWKRQGFLYDQHINIPDDRFVALMESVFEFNGTKEEGRQALLDLGYTEDEDLGHFTENGSGPWGEEDPQDEESIESKDDEDAPDIFNFSGTKDDDEEPIE
jgi:hypothetical protein